MRRVAHVRRAADGRCGYCRVVCRSGGRRLRAPLVAEAAAAAAANDAEPLRCEDAAALVTAVLTAVVAAVTLLAEAALNGLQLPQRRRQAAQHRTRKTAWCVGWGLRLGAARRRGDRVSGGAKRGAGVGC